MLRDRELTSQSVAEASSADQTFCVMLQFVVRNGSELQLNGQVFKFTGANCYYLLQKASDNSTRSLVSLMQLSS